MMNSVNPFVVRCVDAQRLFADIPTHLTKDKNYMVTMENEEYYMLLNDVGRVEVYLKSRFVIVNQENT